MKTVLVAVSGMSPAIITETLWALAGESPPVVPDEVVIITTTKGERDIQDMLLTAKEDWGGKKVWECLRADIFQRTGQPAKSKGLQLSVKIIDLPDEDTGIRQKADDLRTRADHDEAANFIVQTLASYCDVQDIRVIASIAGGRKTMGALLYAAMSLVGRESDRVTHVLVSEPFENCKGFFYSGQPVQALTATPFGKPPIPVQATDAKVEMADIPFVPLRNKFKELDEPRRTFAGLVEQYARAERGPLKQPPRVSLEILNGILTVERRPLTLTGRDLLIAAFLYERALQQRPHFQNKDEAETDLAVFMARWKQERPFHQATVRLSGGAATVHDIPKALTNLRTKLVKAGISGAIAHLAPERDRIGFDIRGGA